MSACPIIVLATPLAFAEMWLGLFSVTAVKEGVTYPHSYFVDFIVLFSTGRMVIAYWYIPFIFLVFLASPLFDRFIELSRGWRAAVFAASIAIAFWVVRPVENLNPVQCFFYFANFYMFGILFCEYRKPIMDFVSRPAVLAALGAADPRHRLPRRRWSCTFPATSSACRATAGDLSASMRCSFRNMSASSSSAACSPMSPAG